MLVAPAGPVTDQRIETGIARAHHLGLQPVLGRAVRQRNGYLAGSDAARGADLQRALDDDDIDAIWALRGGYGMMRLLPRLDLSPLERRRKAFIGFSDNTAFHLALAKRGFLSFHAPHAGYEEFPPFAEHCFRSVLFEARPAGLLARPPGDAEPRTLVGGSATGRLMGGNLALLSAVCGTPYALEADGAILVIEDVDEAVYRVDRMLVQLVLAGALEGVAGVVFGRFTRLRGERPERTLRAVLLEWATTRGIPAVHDMPFGHVPENWTLPLGAHATLDADARTLEILEPAVE